MIRGTNLGFGRALGGKYVYVSEDKVRSHLSRNITEPGDLVFTQRGTLGQVALVPNDDYPVYVISQSQMRLRVNPLIASTDYLYYACSSEQFLKQIDDNAISTGVPHINLGIISRLSVPLPTLPTQRAIAAVLGALDDKIAANTKLAATADELAASLSRQGLDSANPAPLSSIADIMMGSSPSGLSLNEIGEGTVFYQGVRDFGFRFPSNRVWTNDPIRFASTGDTLLSVRAPVGRVNLATEETCIGRGVASIRSTTGRPFTLFHLLKDSGEVWEPFEAEGTVFGSISKAQLASLRLPGLRPGFADQLEDSLAPLERTIASALSENTTLAATRDALLPQLMSGKLRVKDAEAAVSAAV